ncbi:MAG: methylmalonyl-CoA mutase family protein [Granulosicoccus sp.]
MSAASSGTTDASSTSSKQTNVDLDHVFSPPTRDEWLTQALAGLPNHDTLDSISRKTLDDLSIGVLYDTAPENAYVHLGQHSGTAGSWDNRLRIAGLNDSTANRKALKGLEKGNSSVELHVNQNTDLTTVLHGVRLDISPVSFRAGLHYPLIAEQLHSYINTECTNKEVLSISLNVDPIGDWLFGTSDVAPIQDTISKMANFAAEQCHLLPQVQAVLVDTTVHHNAGATAKQELIAALMSATLYLEALLSERMSLDQASQAISFQFACDADVLMGVVKIRAFSNLWRHLLTEFSKAHNTTISNNNLQPRIVVETSQRYLSTVDHWNNHLRNIAACSAAALSSVQTILVHPHDQVGTWQAESDGSLGERIARNLPIILDRECGLTHVTDPMAGSYAIETLTEQLSHSTWGALKEFDSADHWIKALIDGQWQQRLTESHEKRVARLNSDAEIMVGINRYQPSNNKSSAGNSALSTHSTARLQPVRDAEVFEGAAQ